MNLLQKLDQVWPSWRKDYDDDPLAAALDLGLIKPEDASAATEYQPLNFHDEAYAWSRVAEQWYEEHGDDGEEEPQ